MSSISLPVKGEAPIAEVLDAAADLIEPEGKWCQHHHAISEFGYPIHNPMMGRVCRSYCPEGAILAQIPPGGTGALGLKSVHDLTGWLQRVVPGGNVPKWNDAPERTQVEVVADSRAASLAREQGK